MEDKTNRKHTVAFALIRTSLILVSCIAALTTLYFVPAHILGIGFMILLFISIEYRVIVTSRFPREKTEGNIGTVEL